MLWFDIVIRKFYIFLKGVLYYYGRIVVGRFYKIFFFENILWYGYYKVFFIFKKIDIVVNFVVYFLLEKEWYDMIKSWENLFYDKKEFFEFLSLNSYWYWWFLES